MMPAGSDKSAGSVKAWWQRQPPPSGSSSTSKRRRCGNSSTQLSVSAGSSKASGPKASTQLCLDVGQKGLVRATCPQCGMVYLPGDKQDEALHAHQHAAATACLRFNGWSTERCVLQEAKGGRVLLVKAGNAALHLKKVAELCSFVEQAMGWDAGSIQKPHRSLPLHGTASSRGQQTRLMGPAVHGASAADSGGSSQQQVYLLYVTADKRVGGLLVADHITHATVSARQPPLKQLQHSGWDADTSTQEQLLPAESTAAGGYCREATECRQHLLNTTHTNGVRPATEAAEYCLTIAATSLVSGPQQQQQDCKLLGCAAEGLVDSLPAMDATAAGSTAGSTKVVKALMGVRAVWVAADIRRQKVATRLINLARCHVVPGFMVPASQLAFASGPLLEPEALAFAKSYLTAAVDNTHAPPSACAVPAMPPMLVYSM